MSIALLLLAGQAAGPPPPPLATAESSPTVVVTGRRHSREQAVRHMTRTITPITDAGDPLPRFASPLCPEAAGLPAAAATRFADRMRESARRAGLATGKVGCSPNVTVMFVPSGQAVVRALKEKAPTLFGSLEPHQIRRLAADTGPVHVWSFTETMSRDDDRLRVGTTAGRDAPELQVRSASILQAPIRIVVDGAVMLIDQQPSIGKTLTQLADYATMRVLRRLARWAMQPQSQPFSAFSMGGRRRRLH